MVATLSAVAFLGLLGGVLLAIFAVNQRELANDRARFLLEKEQQRSAAEEIARVQSLARVRADQRLANALVEQAHAVMLRHRLGYRKEALALLHRAQELGVNESKLRSQAVAFLGDPLGLPAVDIEYQVPPAPILPDHFAPVVDSNQTRPSKLPGKACLSADGDMLAIPIKSNAKIAFHQRGETSLVLDSPLGAVHALAISKIQDKLIAACEEGFAIWQLSGLIVQNKVSTDTLWDVAIHPSMPMMAVLTSDGKIVLWSLEENRFLAESKPQLCTHIEFTRDGELLVMLNHNGVKRNVAKAFSMRSTPEVQRRWLHAGGTTSVALDDTERWLATCGKDEAIKILEFPSLKEMHTLLKHVANVEELVFSPHNPWLVSADWEGNIYLWDFQKEKILSAVKVNDIDVFGLQFSEDSRFLSVSGRGGIVILEISKEGDQLYFQHVAKHLVDNMVTSVVFHPSNAFVSFNSGAKFLKLELGTADVSPLCTMLCPFSAARSDLQFLGNGDWLTGVSKDRAPVIFDWMSDEVIAVSENGSGTDRFNAHWSQDGQIAVSKPDVRTLVVHDMKRQKIVYQLPSEKFDLWTTTISNSGRWIVSGTSQGELIVWDRNGIEAILKSFNTRADNRP